MKTSYNEIQSFITKDGSLIRELMHPDRHGTMHLSFAQAAVEPGCATAAHQHKKSAEIYHVIQGKGKMTLDEEQFPIGPGDTVYIAPGRCHRVENTGWETLILYCCCAPPYSHEDTEILAEMQ
jgi:mannose-6-phosphate isomerase-like protein (cupin superfamily)